MTNQLIPEEEIEDAMNFLVVPLATRLQLITVRHVLRPADLGLQHWRIVLTLARYGDMHLGKLTNLTSLDPAHASRVAADLESRDLISRRPDPEDSRKRLLSLTNAGANLMTQIWPRYHSKTKSLREIFTDDEYWMLRRLMTRAIAKADKLLAEDVDGTSPRNEA